jgi:hypothetical protein
LPSSRSARGSRCWSSRRRAPCRRGSVCRGARSDDLERTDSETEDPTVRRYAEVLISPNSSFERAFGTDGPPTAGRATQGMGPIGETIRRTWQLAHVMKGRRVGTRDDNARVLRYLGKYMVEPALVHGVANDVGSLAPGQGIARARCHRGRRPAQGLMGRLLASSPARTGSTAARCRRGPTRSPPHEPSSRANGRGCPA